MRHAPLEVLSEPASIEVHALEHCNAWPRGFGFDYIGGTNESAIHWDIVKDLRFGGRTELDGRVVQENGIWVD